MQKERVIVDVHPCRSELAREGLKVDAFIQKKRVIVDVHPCRSELAREGLKVDAFIQKKRVIVDVHREQACSYKGPFLCVGKTRQPIMSLIMRSCSINSRCRASIRDDNGKLVPALRLAKSSC